MFLVDYHIHSNHSFDADRTDKYAVDAICQEAINRGFSEIAITDHHCINIVLDGFWPPVDFDLLRGEVLEAKEKYKGKLSVIYGVELGQPTQRSEEALSFLQKNNFEFVIGSLHNNADKEDFYYLDYSTADKNYLIGLWNDYFTETIDHIKWGKGRFCTLGHLTYPRRYLESNGFNDIVNLSEKKDIIDEIFKTLINCEIALEVNASGLRQGLGDALPCIALVSRYLELGGEMITIGSDSHRMGDLGSGIINTMKNLSDIGVKYLTRFSNMKPYFEKI